MIDVSVIGGMAATVLPRLRPTADAQIRALAKSKKKNGTTKNAQISEYPN